MTASPLPRRRLAAKALLALTSLGIVALLGVNRVIGEDLPGPLLPPMDPLPQIGSLSAQACASCHRRIAQEWADTAHGQATTDPLYQADLARQGNPHYCDHCHAPLVEQRPTVAHGILWPTNPPTVRSSPNPRHVPALRNEGVTCVACHQRDGALIGPHATTLAPHPVKTSDALADPQVCAGCHVLDPKRLGNVLRPLADTLAEWREYRRLGGQRTCVDCHMPRTGPRPVATGGPLREGRSHALRGAFDGDFVRAGVGVEAVALIAGRGAGARAALELVNRTGHRAPTAEPHRSIEVALEVTDARGKTVAQARQSLRRVVDLHTLTERPGQDTTLLPAERRVLALEVTGPLPATSARVTLRVHFVLRDPDDPVARDSGLAPDRLRHTLYEEHRDLTQAPRTPGPAAP